MSRVSDRAGSQVPLPPPGWLIKSVRTQPAPAALWLSRGVIDPEVRLPTAVSPPSEERQQLVITNGIDPHKSSLTAVAVSPDGQAHTSIRLVVDKNTPAALLTWAEPWPERQWADVGATGLGRGIAQQLVTTGDLVLDVPAKLAARARLLRSSSARKTDVADAISVAAVALHNRRLDRVQLEDHTTILRLLTERRDDLVAEHTRWINRLHVLLRDLHPGGAEVRLDTTEASALLAKIRPVTAADQQRKQIARDVVRDLRRHEASIKELENQLRSAVTDSGTTLTQIQGIGFLTAAKILALTGDIYRFPNQEHTPATRVPRLSTSPGGEQETHRLSRRGNRQLNAAIHVAAITQGRDPGPGRARPPSTRPPRKPAAASNAGSRTPSTVASWPTSNGSNSRSPDTQRRSSDEDEASFP